MTEDASASYLQRLLVGYLVAAKTSLDDAGYEQLKALLPGYLAVAKEMVPLEVLADQGILRHAVHSLASGNSVEETLMYTFMLHIYLLSSTSRHPLEVGIIRQQIIGLLPVFARASGKGYIRPDVFNANEALLMSIADKTEQQAEALQMLENAYTHYRAAGTP